MIMENISWNVSVPLNVVKDLNNAMHLMTILESLLDLTQSTV